ncbi:MAG: hypothetical protein GY869_11820, partial [Planctomycetes bacterium]|nr:hypothetical protein [Planctomycetota bacterium]
MDNNDLFELAAARAREAERRLKLLGDHAQDADYDYDRLCDRARDVFVPAQVLIVWWRGYQSDGLSGLIPDDWTELVEKTQATVLDRYNQLGDAADAEIITPNQIAEIADKNGWLYRRAEGWLRRYRVG